MLSSIILLLYSQFFFVTQNMLTIRFFTKTFSPSESLSESIASMHNTRAPKLQKPAMWPLLMPLFTPVFFLLSLRCQNISCAKVYCKTLLT